MAITLSRSRWSSAARLAVLGALLAAAGCRNAAAPVAPSIVFDVVPEATAGGSDRLAPIAGHVAGAHQGQRVVLFTRSGVWWVQPFAARPFTELDAGSAWKTTIHLGTEYAALLVEPSYRPPATVETLPPVGGGVLAVATVKGTGGFSPPAPATLSFSGYDWEVRQIPSERGGGSEYDARNAWVDASGYLHLAVTERDGRWTSAEVKLTRALGYGTYAFAVRDADRLDPAVALGLLTWDDLAVEQNHRELDIEISRWGVPGNKNAQYVVQPQYVAANVFRFVLPPGLITHTFRWEPGRASFKTTRGSSARRSPSIVAQRVFTSGVPVPGAETVHINLLYYRSSPARPQRTVEVILEKFEYLP